MPSGATTKEGARKDEEKNYWWGIFTAAKSGKSVLAVGFPLALTRDWPSVMTSRAASQSGMGSPLSPLGQA